MNLFPVHLPNFFSESQDTFVGALRTKMGHQIQVIKSNPWSLGASVFALDLVCLYIAEKISSKFSYNRYEFLKKAWVQTSISYTFKAVFMGGAIVGLNYLFNLNVKRMFLAISVISTLAFKILWNKYYPPSLTKKEPLPPAQAKSGTPPAQKINPPNSPPKNSEPAKNEASLKTDDESNAKKEAADKKNNASGILDDGGIAPHPAIPGTPGTPEYKSEEVTSDVERMMETGHVPDDNPIDTAILAEKIENL